LAGLTEPVALDRAREDHRRRAAMLDRGLVRRVDLQRIVAAESQPLELRIGEMRDHLSELRILSPEVLADVAPRLDRVLLHFAVEHLGPAAREQAGFVF